MKNTPLHNAIRMKFNDWQKVHPNFMTPKVKKVEIKNRKVWELSEGTGFYGDPLFGVTELDFVGGKKVFESQIGKGQAFQTKKKAERYMEKLMRGKF